MLEDYLLKRANEPLLGLSDFARKAAAEGAVLLKNDGILPILKENIAVFGRIQLSYYKSGTGSGGLVNVHKVTSIIDGLKENPNVTLNEDLLKTYESWTEKNPFNFGNGMWASEPWSQAEMPLTDEIVKKAKTTSKKAIIVIGRTAGEDRDNSLDKGSFLLTDLEEEMISLVTKYFDKTIVVLNVGNIIDLRFMDKYPISGLLIAWHGGMEGGRAISDILTGIANPSGKLVDTIALNPSDYIANSTFGNKDHHYYTDDIYVGYRYFQTFQPENVRYPFGFGLSYTEFSFSQESFSFKNNTIKIYITVTNKGFRSGKETVMIYYSAPQGVLGHPKRELIAFQKTKELMPLESQVIFFEINIDNLASFDDEGTTGFYSSYVLEKGEYLFYVGGSVDKCEAFGEIYLDETRLVKTVQSITRVKKPFNRLKPKILNGHIYQDYKPVFVRNDEISEIISNHQSNELPIKTNNINFNDVIKGLASLDDFISQLSPLDLIHLTRGEGMSSPKVTPGIAGCFGGVTDHLLSLGVPLVGCSDGPSGIRMDSGKKATSLPNETMLACTMNYDLVRYLYYLVGKELEAYQIDILLAPGVNIHKSPLNGRNFEYFSEDPLVSGLMGSAVIKGLNDAKKFGCLKHLACNNQENQRSRVDSIVSERALREIYLKSFEIAVKCADPAVIMTSYNPINGVYAANNFELNTLLLRDEWNYKGMVITDWWPAMNGNGEYVNTKDMLISQNDVYMVTSSALDNSRNDNSEIMYNDSKLPLSILQRSARNILMMMMRLERLGSSYKASYLQYFKTSHDVVKYETLSMIFVGGKEVPFFNPLVSVYYLKNKYTKDIKFETSKEVAITFNDDKKIVLLQLINNYYLLNFEKEETPCKNFDIMELKTDNYIALLDNLQVHFKDILPVYKSRNISIKDNLQFTARGETIVYGIDVINEGDYIFSFNYSSTALRTSQITISVNSNNDLLGVLILSGTDGKEEKATYPVHLNAGKQFISINFRKTGIIGYSYSFDRKS